MTCEACPFGKTPKVSLEGVLSALSACDRCALEAEQGELISLLRGAGKALRKSQADLRRATQELRELERTGEDDLARIEKLERLHKAASEELDLALAARDALVREQSASIRALGAPILEVSEGVLAVPLIGAFEETRAQETMQALLSSVVSAGARVVVLDLTGTTTIDARTGDHIASICKAVSLIGARVIVSGLRPDVVRGIVDSGVEMAGLLTVRSLKDAIARARRA